MNDFARQIFADSGLTYNDMFDHISILKDEISKELSLHLKTSGMLMKLSRKQTVRFAQGTRNVECFFLFVDGAYFKRRECISFNPNGFVGFAGWASAENSTPIIKGFMTAIGKIKTESI